MLEPLPLVSPYHCNLLKEVGQQVEVGGTVAREQPFGGSPERSKQCRQPGCRAPRQPNVGAAAILGVRVSFDKVAALEAVEHRGGGTGTQPGMPRQFGRGCHAAIDDERQAFHVGDIDAQNLRYGVMEQHRAKGELSPADDDPLDALGLPDFTHCVCSNRYLYNEVAGLER